MRTITCQACSVSIVTHLLVADQLYLDAQHESCCVPPGNLPPRVGVVRDAFAAHDQEPRLLAASVAPLGQGSAAVASALSQGDSRQVVDEYEFGRDGQYHIKLVATDLLRWRSEWPIVLACFYKNVATTEDDYRPRLQKQLL